MSNIERDGFGIVKKFPDLEGDVTLEQGGPEWGETYTQHGYKSIPGVKIWRKTFNFNKKLKPDQEVTIYVFLPKLNKEYGSHPKVGKCQSGSGLSIKLRGGTHSNEGENSAHCYIFHYEYEGGDCNNFQKEYPHPTYDKNDINEQNKFPNWIGKVMGFKGAAINTDDDKHVEFWCWFDESASVDNNGNLVTNNDWKLRYHGKDTGKDDGKYGGGDRKKPFTTTWGKLTEFRMDNADKETKAFCASIREIRRP